jgi:urease beta subunit
LSGVDRPGETIVGSGPAPAAQPTRTATITIINRGRFDAYLTSHFPIARASAALEFPRAGLEGARLHLPAGASARIPVGEPVSVELMWD